MKEFSSKGEVRLRLGLVRYSQDIVGQRKVSGWWMQVCHVVLWRILLHFLLYCGVFAGDRGRFGYD